MHLPASRRINLVHFGDAAPLDCASLWRRSSPFFKASPWPRPAGRLGLHLRPLRAVTTTPSAVEPQLAKPVKSMQTSATSVALNTSPAAAPALGLVASRACPSPGRVLTRLATRAHLAPSHDLLPSEPCPGSLVASRASRSGGAPATRRGLLLGVLCAASCGGAAQEALIWAAPPPSAAQSDPAVRSLPDQIAPEVAPETVFCVVSPGALPGGIPAPGTLSRRFASVSEAVAACPDGGVVLVAEGRYQERLVLRRPVTVRAWPQGAAVELVWQTSEPYQSTIEVDTAASGSSSGSSSGSGGGSGGGGGVGAEAVLEGLTVRHSSKSVANNYSVYIKSGSPRLTKCDISSSTGAGVGVEGASPRILGCRVHDCARQGLAIFGATAFGDLDLDLTADSAMLYGMSGGIVQGCDVYGNALDGMLVRSGASPDILDNLIHNNGGVGVNLQDCSGRYEGNTVYDNAKGSVAVSALFELDPGNLAGSNSLRGLMRRL